MMNKIRVQDISKDFGKTNKEIAQILADVTQTPAKKANNTLEEKELDILFETMTQKNQVENFEKYFAMLPKEQPKPAPEKKPAKTAEKPKAEPKQATEKKPAPKAEKPAEVKEKKPAKKPAEQREKKPVYKPTATNVQFPANAKPHQPKKKDDTNRAPQARTKGDMRHIDTRASNVDLEKYNEKYEKIAPSKSINDNSNKQKLKQKSQQYRKQGMRRTRRETESQRLARIAAERAKKPQMQIKIGEEISVSDLASLLRMTAGEVMKKLIALGVMATVNEIIDFDTAAIVAGELGAKVEKEVVITIEERVIEDTEDTEENTVPRDPVVVVMGHVDHGKTSILDAIRNTSVTSTEAGGITQHIGAYRVDVNGQKITFLDTPGHAAFTEMRARGAMATDIAILVVAADDGIMPQTIEAINHAKAADVSIIVAINKMDKPDATTDKIMQQLTEHGLVPEEWGGDIICVPVSAKTRMNIDTLLENVCLVAEMRELRANPSRSAKGIVIEAKLDKGRGPVATLLVQNGTLNSGDAIVAGMTFGRVRVMTDERGNKLETAGPSVPVEIMGLDAVPQAGDTFNAVTDERLARELVEQRKNDAKQEQFNLYQKVTLENLFDSLEAGNIKDLNIIVKADVQGSVEAVKQSLLKIENDEVRVRVIHDGVGAVNESDVMLANASNAIVVAFNVYADPVATENANRDGVDIRTYSIIYDAIEEIEAAMRGMRAPKYRDVDVAKVEVREVYKISSSGTVAGSYVLEGKVPRGGKVRLMRDGKQIAEDVIAGLKRFKDDVKEVAAGYECGVSLETCNDINPGDIFEIYITEEYRD